MNSLNELGAAFAVRRRALGLKQRDVADAARITQESLSRIEHGRVAEFGARKLLQVLAVLGLEIELREAGTAGSLDELRRERGVT